jgi:hypothetical protein
VPKKSKWKNLRIQLRKRLEILGKMEIKLSDYVKNDVFPTKSYSRPGSYELIEACKMGDITTAKSLLIDNPFLVHDYDHVRIVLK